MFKKIKYSFIVTLSIIAFGFVFSCSKTIKTDNASELQGDWVIHDISCLDCFLKNNKEEIIWKFNINFKKGKFGVFDGYINLKSQDEESMLDDRYEILLNEKEFKIFIFRKTEEEIKEQTEYSYYQEVDEMGVVFLYLNNRSGFNYFGDNVVFNRYLLREENQ